MRNKENDGTVLARILAVDVERAERKSGRPVQRGKLCRFDYRRRSVWFAQYRVANVAFSASVICNSLPLFINRRKLDQVSMNIHVLISLLSSTTEQHTVMSIIMNRNPYWLILQFFKRLQN